jgi:NitT/TauT family transport system permease protein
VNATAKAGLNWQGWIALVALVAALALPLVTVGAGPDYLLASGSNGILAALLVVVAVLAGLVRRVSAVGNLIMFIGGLIAAGLAATALGGVSALATRGDLDPFTRFAAAGGFWALVLVAWMLAWVAVKRLSVTEPYRPFGGLLLRIFIPLVFGATIIFLWEALVRGFAVPFVILPPPSAVWAKLTAPESLTFFSGKGIIAGTLWIDFRQTFLKSVLAGYAIGCLSGFAVAVIADRVPFLGRGLLPIGNLVSALPIIGVAPIMVMWFGFDWPSKAAVVAAMTFFPMLVNTLAGLNAADATQRDLMHTYAADYRQQLGMLRLPVALPFIFNALKINSTLAMIGAIVAEFFGTPIFGMGFRISTEVGRMNTDMVWAEIAVAALAGSAFYGIVSLIERAATFWHPSFRQS